MKRTGPAGITVAAAAGARFSITVGTTPRSAGTSVPASSGVSARSGAGVKELWAAIRARPLRRGIRRDADELFRLLRERLAARFAASRGEAEGLAARWQAGTVTTEEALTELAGMVNKAELATDEHR